MSRVSILAGFSVFAVACGGAPFTVEGASAIGDDAGPAVIEQVPAPDPAPDAARESGEASVAAVDAATVDDRGAQPDASCGPTTCAGCCGVGALSGMCFEGVQTQACGVGGEACRGMSGPPCWTCTAGVCGARPTCDSTNCAGCCDGSGTCQSSQADTSCGSGGAACTDCTSTGQTCHSGSCETSCTQVTHTTGYGQTFQDCAPLGQWSQALAIEACHAYAGSGASCLNTTCNGVPVVQLTGTACVVWAWEGPDLGHTQQASIGSTACACPTSSSPQWQ